jgi:hypothetical protein
MVERRRTLRFKLLNVALALACLMMSATVCAAQTELDGDGRWHHNLGEPWWFSNEKYTEAEAAAAREKWQQIAGVLKASRDEWAGDYSLGGDTFLHIIRWTPEGGYVSFNVNLCMATVRELDYGDVVSASPEQVEVISRRGTQAATKRKYVKVKWGAQRYLIEEHAVSNFCDYVVGLGAYNGPNGIAGYDFLSHSDDGDAPTAVLPTVPPEYRDYVRAPIDARIVKVGKSYVEVDPENDWWNELITPVTINVGSDKKLKRGMTLHILDSDEYDERVEITRVGADYARGIIVRSVRKHPGVKVNEWDDGKDIPQQPISVGWRLTTSVHKQSLRLDERHAAWEAKQNKH